jgi:phycocyanobilin lyase subunit alpha
MLSPMEDAADSQSSNLTAEQALLNLQGDDLGLRFYAAWWLGRFRVQAPGVVAALIAALADEQDRTEAGGYPLRRNAARALGKLGDAEAVPALVQSLACTDFYVREAAAQSLEMLGDTACVPPLIQLLQDRMPGTLPAPEPPHLAQPYDAILEALGRLGAVEAISDIQPFLDHAVPRIRFAALRAMYQLSADPEVANRFGDQLAQALNHPDLQLRRTVLADLGAIGYLGAAPAIAETLAENSLKLIALKGVLEQQLTQATPPNLSPGAIQVMELMDQLL